MIADSEIALQQILPYIFLERKPSSKKGNFSELELTVIEEKKVTIRIRKKEKKNIEELAESEEKKTVIKSHEKIKYEFFIPVEALNYSSAQIKYSTEKNKEKVELALDDKSLIVEKPSAESVPYTILFNYDSVKQGYHVKYEAEYSNRLEQARQDFTSRIDKALDLLPKSLMGGILGFTYLGSGKMTRRDDLFGDMAMMVDVHEAIHTTDEYETRRLTDWMLLREMPKYKR